MKDFDRQFAAAKLMHTIMFRIVASIIAFIFLLVVMIWGVIGYGAYTVIQDPSIVGKTAGEIVKGFEETK